MRVDWFSPRLIGSCLLLLILVGGLIWLGLRLTPAQQQPAALTLAEGSASDSPLPPAPVQAAERVLDDVRGRFAVADKHEGQPRQAQCVVAVQAGDGRRRIRRRPPARRHRRPARQIEFHTTGTLTTPPGSAPYFSRLRSAMCRTYAPPPCSVATPLSPLPCDPWPTNTNQFLSGGREGTLDSAVALSGRA